VNIGPLKSLAAGFSGATVLIWTCNAITLANVETRWLAASILTIALISFSSIISLRLKKKRNITANAEQAEKWRKLVFALQGAVLACWIFDLTTTFYAINITHVATEVNPLGWPLAILGALAYYGPTLALSYVLLFRIKESFALYAAIPVTAVALLMGVMNLHAGTMNFEVFAGTASLATELGYGFLTLTAIAGYASIRIFYKRNS